MIPPHDPFSDAFDAIEIDPARAPSAEAIDRALAFCAPQETTDVDAPGFYLIDDAQGRFIVDRNTGVVMLRDESILERERGEMHTAKLRVVEASGFAYTLELSLRLTGAVPQMAGDEDWLNELSSAAQKQPQSVAGQAEQAPAAVTWSAFTAFANAAKPMLGGEYVPFGTLLEAAIPSVKVGFAGLTIVEDVPAPNIRTAIWTP